MEWAVLQQTHPESTQRSFSFHEFWSQTFCCHFRPKCRGSEVACRGAPQGTQLLSQGLPVLQALYDKVLRSLLAFEADRLQAHQERFTDFLARCGPGHTPRAVHMGREVFYLNSPWTVLMTNGQCEARMGGN